MWIYGNAWLFHICFAIIYSKQKITLISNYFCSNAFMVEKNPGMCSATRKYQCLLNSTDVAKIFRNLTFLNVKNRSYTCSHYFHLHFFFLFLMRVSWKGQVNVVFCTVHLD